ncbi:MAG: 2,3-bisphosphoglycerate-independent phosphoglycerate mutase [Methylococcales symbiont of Hymedesmia sp. n. MRB-2018]|nr:MAG: 2,3-bisphosphoglycerate-independent phosphoglycerate mutase [Methylococcales symbiont of Hymedesmia sp. n. MRB-2018]
MSNRPKPVVLLILDGFGYSEQQQNNAIAMANTPCWDKMQKQYPMTLLDCAGGAVGLPQEQMGNSEVGHLHIGSGRLMRQELSKVTAAIADNSFFSNTVLCQAVDQAISKDKALHIMGLLSPGGVHSHQQQILAMVELAVKRGLKKVYMHAFLDGRDVPPKSAMHSINLLEAKFSELGAGQIISVTGRFYAMDRDNRWERVQIAHQLIAKGESEYQANSATEALKAAYARNETDEFVMPTAIMGKEGHGITLDPEDSIVFMNFRADRAREISRALTELEFDGFERNCTPHSGYFATLTQYHEAFDYPIAYAPVEVKNGIGEVLADAGLHQLRLAETEKYAHVTFFLNGGRDEPFKNEDRILVPSPKVKTYDLQPEMSAADVTQHLLNSIKEQKHDVIICNYANCDMVGHTGVIDAAVKAVETIDASLQQIIDGLNEVNGQMLVTADHGNIEMMVGVDTGQAHTAHTTNLVPLVHVGGNKPLSDGGSLSDLAPTILDILDLKQPIEMTGHSLI